MEGFVRQVGVNPEGDGQLTLDAAETDEVRGGRGVRAAFGDLAAVFFDLPSGAFEEVHCPLGQGGECLGRIGHQLGGRFDRCLGSFARGTAEHLFAIHLPEFGDGAEHGGVGGEVFPAGKGKPSPRTGAGKAQTGAIRFRQGIKHQAGAVDRFGGHIICRGDRNRGFVGCLRGARGVGQESAGEQSENEGEVFFHAEVGFGKKGS